MVEYNRCLQDGRKDRRTDDARIYRQTDRFFLFLHENRHCDYSLEAPLRDTHYLCFHLEIRAVVALSGVM